MKIRRLHPSETRYPELFTQSMLLVSTIAIRHRSRGDGKIIQTLNGLIHAIPVPLCDEPV